MKYRIITLFIMFAILLYVLVVVSMPILAQQPPTMAKSPISSSPDLQKKLADTENRVFYLEMAQKQQIASLNESNDRYKFLLTAFGVILGALVVVQSLVAFIQMRRESSREARQTNREQERDLLEHAGAQRVSEIMSVVRETLNSRLTAEKEAREEAKKTRAQLETVLDEVKSLDRFFKSFQANIQNTRIGIEDSASRLVQVPRHDFRAIANDLNSFAQQFDTFKSQYEAIEEEPRRFSSKVLYIRGIAAHYSNKPEIAKPFLTEVIGLQQPEAGDTDNAYKRRIANAHYYLGITESNFGNAQAAIDSFEQANSLDPDGTDFLTKVVTAEAYVMKGVDEFNKAQKFISEIESGLQRKRDSEGRLAGVYLRLQSRSFLVLSNMAILKREEDWLQKVEKLLNPIHNDDPGYYYLTATLAQICALQNNSNKAQKLFCEAYDAIERSGDFLTVTEARSQILLRMVAGLCCQHGLSDKKKSNDHLDKADSLRSILPKIDSQVCTVFSTLSKRNEKSETIHDHIEFIRKGKLLLQS
jgi:tetratricopeptide (TPR) repeat protein